MTREEAIYTLRGLFIPCASDGNKCGCDRNETIDMAIEALSANDEINEMNRDIIKDILKMMPTAYLLEALGVDTFDELMKPADAVQGWIPCNKQMPDELEAVNVTWVNHLAPPYYKHIEDVPFVDSAVYYKGKWYWWDATVIDVLAEYGEDCNAEQIDKDIEILAWQPLPKPYKGGDTK